MAFGQQPQGNNAQNNGFNNQYQYNQQYNQYNAQPQYAYAPNGTAAVNVQTTYSYEQAERSSVNSAYTHMTLGLIVTAVVAIITQMSGAYLALIQTTGIIGIFAPAVIEIVLAIYLGARIHTMKVSTAYVMFYVYAALMGFTLSTIFMAYDLGTIRHFPRIVRPASSSRSPCSDAPPRSTCSRPAPSFSSASSCLSSPK